jgi:hypothetical protein
MNSFRATPEWKGQTAYIIGGGPSLLQQNLDVLRGKNVIVINSSYQAFMDAQFLVFSDMRWWIDHRLALQKFQGRIISTQRASSGHPNMLHMIRKSAQGLAEDSGTLMVAKTTLTAAINLAVHLGVNKIVLLGIDQSNGPDGRTHHHKPHAWKQQPNCFRRQQIDMPIVAQDLKRLNIECVNASARTALTLWPVVRLEDHLGDTSCDRDAGFGRQHIPASLYQDACA